jgi:ABC-type polysaccharide/polyol phosphate export permease
VKNIRGSALQTFSTELLWNLTLRELRGKYRRSFLGWAWSLLNPLASVVIYGFVFGVVFGSSPPVGDPSGLDNYALYLLSGVLPWGFYNLITGLGLNAMISNGGLVRKVAFRRETLVYAQSLFSFVQFTIEIALLTVIVSVAGSHAWVWVPMTLVLMLLLMIFATGIGLALSAIAVYFRDLPYLWTIITQVYFFVTPIIYDRALLKGRVSNFVYVLLEWNPMAMFVRSFRHTLYDGTGPLLVNVLYLTAISVLSFALGLFVFGRLNRRLAEEI